MLFKSRLEIFMKKVFLILIKFTFLLVLMNSFHDLSAASNQAGKKTKVVKAKAGKKANPNRANAAKAGKKANFNRANAAKGGATCNPKDLSAVAKGSKLLATGKASAALKAAYKRVVACYKNNGKFFQGLDIVCDKTENNQSLSRVFSKMCANINSHKTPSKTQNNSQDDNTNSTNPDDSEQDENNDTTNLDDSESDINVNNQMQNQNNNQPNGQNQINQYNNSRNYPQNLANQTYPTVNNMNYPQNSLYPYAYNNYPQSVQNQTYPSAGLAQGYNPYPAGSNYTCNTNPYPNTAYASPNIPSNAIQSYPSNQGLNTQNYKSPY